MYVKVPKKNYSCYMYHCLSLGTEFTLEHLCWLMRKLDDLAPKWKDFGIQLDVPYCECSKIEVDYRKCSDCLRETVVWWLTNSTRPNSLDLINALNNIGEKRLAHSIQQDLCQGSKLLSIRSNKPDS